MLPKRHLYIVEDLKLGISLYCRQGSLLSTTVSESVSNHDSTTFYKNARNMGEAILFCLSPSSLRSELLLCMVRPSREIIYPVISTGINAKYSIAHSHAWDTGRIYVVLI